MNRYPLWRYLLILALIIFGVLYSIPMLYGEDPAVQITSRDASQMPADVPQTVKTLLTKQDIPYSNVTKENNSVLVRLTSAQNQIKAQDVIQATLGNNYSVAMNLAPKTPKWLLSIGAAPMKLGLDLRGGVHFLLQVDTRDLIAQRQKEDIRSMGNELRNQHVRYAGSRVISGKGFMLRFRDTQSQEKALPLLQEKFPNYTFIDQQDHNDPVIVAELNQNALLEMRKYAIEQNLAILRTRVQQLGITEPVIQQQGVDQISVDLPGIQDMAEAKSLIGKMATVRFQLVYGSPQDAVVAVKSGVVPFGAQLYKDENGDPVLLQNQVILKGQSIINASPALDRDGRPSVNLRLGGSEVSSFNRITGDNIHKPLAVVYVENETQKTMQNGKVVSKNVLIEKVINVATIQSALGNDFQITGLSSMRYASNLALLLRSGAYSARMTFASERAIGPSLGQKNIEMGALSLEIGSIIVFIFMILYYRLFGIVADCALFLNIIFIVAIMSIVGATLTLPGIAGIVLTVGMAVDANVLINERIREELRNGVSPLTSITRGYDRAFSTIIDANVTTLIIAVILLALGSTTVQNFAVTLIVGLLTSMVTAIFFTRTLVNFIYAGKSVKNLSIGIKMK